MKKSFRILICFFFPVFLGSCNNSQPDDLQSKLGEAKAGLNTCEAMLQNATEENLELEQRISLLKSEICKKSGVQDNEANKINELIKANMSLKYSFSSLEKDFDSLNLKYNQTKAINEELESWTSDLVEGYGTGIWYFRDGLYPVFYKKIETDDPKKIIEELNQLLIKKSLPRVFYQGERDKTIVVKIEDDTQLTQEMGSFGPQAYFKVVTYSLASLKRINCVDFVFEEGDHAEPGKYCR